MPLQVVARFGELKEHDDVSVEERGQDMPARVADACAGSDVRPSLAAYNGLSCHHEMIGHVLAYDPRTVVFSTDDGGLGWIDLYRRTFPLATFRPLHEFRERDFDHVVILTDDDFTYPGTDAGKIICIDHSMNVRRSTGVSRDRRWSTRFFPNRPHDAYVLPTYEIVEELEKRRVLDASDAVRVVCIGSVLEGRDVACIERVLDSMFSKKNLSSGEQEE